jgi:DNA recombination protein RmuC
VPELERKLAATQQALSNAIERKAALESDLSRLPELEARRAQAAAALEEASRAGSDLRASESRLTAELAAERDNLASLRGQWDELRARFNGKGTEANALSVEVSQLRNTLESERSVSEEKLALLLDAKAALTDQFKTLANDILEEKSKRFTEQNQTNLGALLDPLKLKITEFQSKIEDSYVKEGNERSALGVELRHLKELNQQLSEMPRI